VLAAHIYLYLKHVNHTQTILVYINMFIDATSIKKCDVLQFLIIGKYVMEWKSTEFFQLLASNDSAHSYILKAKE
jgi:hypothetical protein